MKIEKKTRKKTGILEMDVLVGACNDFAWHQVTRNVAERVCMSTSKMVQSCHLRGWK